MSIVFFNDTATTEIYSLSLHDALPICLGAPDQAVGRLHGDGADHVVTQVLGDLEGQRLAQVGEGHLDLQGVEQVGHRVARELDVDDRPGDPDDAAGRLGGRTVLGDGHLYCSPALELALIRVFGVPAAAAAGGGSVVGARGHQ